VRAPSNVADRDPDPYSDVEVALFVAAAGLECTVDETTPIRTGADTTYRVRVTEPDGASRRLVLKAAAGSDHERFRREPALLAYVAETTDVPVPAVIGSHLDPTDLPAPAYLMEYVEGTTPTRQDAAGGDGVYDADTLATVARQAGTHLAAVHDCGPLPSAGPVDVADGTLVVQDESVSWTAWLSDLVADAGDGLSRLSVAADDVTSAIDSAMSALSGVELVPAHYDYQPRNVLVDTDSDQVTAVLDWGAMRSVHWEYELALTEQYCAGWGPLDSDRRRQVRTRLYEGYRERRPFDIDAAFRRRRRLYLLVSTVATLPWAAAWEEGRADRFRRHQGQLIESLLDSLAATDS